MQQLDVIILLQIGDWFGKLTPVIDEDAKIIDLVVPQEEVTRRYEDNIKKIVSELGIKFKGMGKQERYNYEEEIEIEF